MTIEDKIKNAKTSDWLTRDIPKWELWIIKIWARMQIILMEMKGNGKRDE